MYALISDAFVPKPWKSLAKFIVVLAVLVDAYQGNYVSVYFFSFR